MYIHLGMQIRFRLKLDENTAQKSERERLNFHGELYRQPVARHWNRHVFPMKRSIIFVEAKDNSTNEVFYRII